MMQLDLFGGKPVKDDSVPLTQKKADNLTTPKQVEKAEESKQAKALEIPADQILDEKLYYPISEVAKMFNVNISLLRFWEKEFDILKPRKNRKGDRLFRPEDIRNLKMIHFLLKEKGYTIKGAKTFIKKGKKADLKFEAIESLKRLRGMLIELKSGLI
jgi:DNA-binding transcriptional MerR regulator